MQKHSLLRRKAYQKSFDKYGVDPRALQWKNEESAELRYSNLTQDLNYDGKSILDVGCGFGDLVAFIEKKSNSFSYIGIDVVPEFIREAKKRYPQHEFIVGDWEEDIKRADIVFCSGVLNHKMPQNQYRYREERIALLFENAGEALAFNMAGNHPQPKNSDRYKVYYVDSLKIIAFCMRLTAKVIVRHHYRRRDFTVIMFK